MVIDVEVPGGRNLVEKEPEEILKYKGLITEIQHMCNVKAKVIALIIGTNGTISKSLIQYTRKARN